MREGGWRGRGRRREGREGREESFQLPVTSLTPDPPREHPGSRGTVPKRRARQRPDRHLDTCHQECECHGEERICRGCPPPPPPPPGSPAARDSRRQRSARTKTHTRGARTQRRPLPRRRRASPPTARVPCLLRRRSHGCARERALHAGRVHARLYAASLGARMKNVWAEGPRQTTFT